MLRIWKGPEMEGTDIGIMTMFICSDTEIPTKRIIQLVEQNRDVRRLYFGAGKKPFVGVTDWKGLFDYVFRKSVDMIIEVPYSKLHEYIALYDTVSTTFICSSYEFPYTYNNLQFKTDDTKVVTVYNAVARTSLDTLKENNLFTCDVMLVEEA